MYKLRGWALRKDLGNYYNFFLFNNVKFSNLGE